MASMRETSRGQWMGGTTVEEINCGSLQRIADATEKMAKSYDALRDERDRYERWWKEEQARTARLTRRITSMKGVITRVKKARGGK